MAVVISTSSVATIEHCKEVMFAPLTASQSIPKVQDFDHISALQHSPNWSLMSDAVQSAVLSSLEKPQIDPQTLLSIAGCDATHPPL
jgi:hypothetical protein